MKKLLFALAALGMLCPMLSGCVDDNPSVVLLGAKVTKAEDLADDQECDLSGTSDMSAFIPLCQLNGSDLPSFSATLMFKNYVSGEVPWTGSGGGSGTTFNHEQSNPGMVWIDRIYLKCASIVDKCAPGDDSCYKEYETSCSGEEALEIPVSFSLSGSEGGSCYGMTYSTQPILNWINDYASDSSNAYAVVDIYGHYHDSGKMSGYTSHILMPVRPGGYDSNKSVAENVEYCKMCADPACCGELKSLGYEMSYCKDKESQ